MMFYKCEFNQPIGNWDISSGFYFVSNGQGLRFNPIRVAFEGTSALTQTLFSSFSKICLGLPQAFHKTSVAGTFAMRMVLTISTMTNTLSLTCSTTKATCLPIIIRLATEPFNPPSEIRPRKTGRSSGKGSLKVGRTTNCTRTKR
jgi:hypothetical protein